MSNTHPFVLKWAGSAKPLPLSDGTMEKLFEDFDDAIRALEQEVNLVTLPYASSVIRLGVDYDQYDRIVELVIQRETEDGILLYGASNWYILPESDSKEK